MRSRSPGLVDPKVLEAPWTPLSFGSGWTNYGSVFAPCAYRRAGNRVFLRGLASSGANAWSSYNVIGTLPVGFRPLKQKILQCPCSGNVSVGLAARVDVQTDGALSLVFNSSGSGSDWISLENFNFDLD